MKTINLYVSKEFLSIAIMSILILTFMLTGLRLIKIIEALSKGIPFSEAFKLLLYVIPYLLSLAIPSSILVSTMLTFGKMSANNEITALRASGISILQIISPIIIFTLLSSCICLYLQLEIGPKYAGVAKHMLQEVGIQHPMVLIEPGMPIEYEQINIFIDNKDQNNNLNGIQVYVLTKDRKKLDKDIFARTGTISVDENSSTIDITLYDAIIKVYEEDGSKKTTTSEQLNFSLNYGDKFNRAKIAEKPKYLTSKELLARLILYKRRGQDTTAIQVELNQRLALGFSPIAFLLLGLPFAIRTSRRETSVGLFLSVILAGIYFTSILIFQAFATKPEIYPHYLLWLPNILYQTGGIISLYKLFRC